MAWRWISPFLLILGGLIMVIPLAFGFTKLREKSGGPLGEVCMAIGLVAHAFLLILWWGPTLLGPAGR